MTSIQIVADASVDHATHQLAPTRKSGDGENSNVGDLICIAQEVSAKRATLLSEIKECLQSGQDKSVIEKARQLCGLTELDPKSKEVSNG